MSILWRGFGVVEIVTSAALATAAAMAMLPGWVRASERTRLAQAASAMQRTAVALAGYHIDHGAYPPSGAAEADGSRPRGEEAEAIVATGVRTANWFAKPGAGARRLVTFRTPATDRGESFATLTTPVAYLESWPEDPFAYTPGASLGYFAHPGGMGWIVWSLGPDRDENAAGGPGEISPKVESLDEARASFPYTGQISPALAGITYDPSNGTLSHGDLWKAEGARRFGADRSPKGKQP